MTIAAAYEHGDPGRRIHRLRKNADLSQLELAGKVGMSRPLVAMWEKGECTPRLTEFQSLARALSTTPEYLAFGRVG